MVSNSLVALVWVVAAFATCVLACRWPAGLRQSGVAVAVGLFVAGCSGGVVLAWRPGPAAVALVVGVVCAWQLLRPASAAVCASLATGCAALAMSVQAGQGMPWPVALMLAATLCCVAAALGRRAGFAPARLVEQALTGIVLAAPVLAAVPDLLEGWRSAQTINIVPATPSERDVPRWVWQFMGLMLLAGVSRELWVRR